MPIRTRTSAAIVLVLAATLGACSKENALDDNLVTVSELQDIFMFEVKGLDNVTDARRYLWAMTGDRAAVDVTSGLTGGSAFLQIRGGDGAIVYAEDIGSEVDKWTETSTYGLWQIDIVFEKASGEFSIIIERTTAEP